MTDIDRSAWLWGEALSALEAAERLHRQFFRAGRGVSRAWEPPVDIVEDEDCITVQVALPGVPAEAVTVLAGAGGITVRAGRAFPAAAAAMRIHQVEIPYGPFERHVRLPAGQYWPLRRRMVDGCLVITLGKRKGTP